MAATRRPGDGVAMWRAAHRPRAAGHDGVGLFGGRRGCGDAHGPHPALALPGACARVPCQRKQGRAVSSARPSSLLRASAPCWMGGVRSCIVRFGAVGGNGEATHQTDLALGSETRAAFPRSSTAMGGARPSVEVQVRGRICKVGLHEEAIGTYRPRRWRNGCRRT